jgi:type II secretory pathway component PulF
MTALSALLDAGVAMPDAITRVGKNANRWSRGHMDLMLFNLRQGMSSGDAISTKLFDQETLDDLRVFGVMSSFAESLKAISVKNIDDAIRKVKTMAGLLSTLILLGAGGSVGWIFSAIYGLSSSIKSAAS